MIDALNDQFGIPGVLVFEAGEGGLTRARVTAQTCTAELYLHGAHLTAWQPAGTEPVLFLSGKSHFAAGEAIRGGIPVIFPWFGARTATPSNPSTEGPSHGFARTTEWQVSFAAAMGEGDDQVVHLALMLTANDVSRSYGYDNFRVAAQFTLGRTLTVKLTVVNESEEPMYVSEALHTYLQVGDATQVGVRGLKGTEFLDKPDGFKRKVQEIDPIRFERETDRVYLSTEATVRVEDSVLKRALVVEKAGSQTTVVWNPWTELSKKLADMDDEGWRSMACVETANVADNALTIAPRSLHTMEARIHVETFAS